jgi:hypothetical protein
MIGLLHGLTGKLQIIVAVKVGLLKRCLSFGNAHR